MSQTEVTLEGCRLTAIRADMVKNNVKMTFETSFDKQMLDAKRDLGFMAYDETLVELTITEQQLRLPLKMNVMPLVAAEPEVSE